METATPTQVTPYIQEALTKFALPEQVIAQWEEEYMPLVVTDLQDKEQYQKVRDARLFVKGKRIEIEKRRKELKEDSLKVGRAIDSEAKRLTALLEPIEEHLLLEEKKVEDEKERIRQEKEKAEKEKLQTRVTALMNLGMVFNGILFSFKDSFNLDSAEYVLEADKIMQRTEEEFRELVKLAAAHIEGIKKKFQSLRDEDIKRKEAIAEEQKKLREMEEEAKRKQETLLKEEQGKKAAALKAKEEELRKEEERLKKEREEVEKKKEEAKGQEVEVEKVFRTPTPEIKPVKDFKEKEIADFLLMKKIEWINLLSLEQNTTMYNMFIKGYDTAVYEFTVILEKKLRHENHT